MKTYHLLKRPVTSNLKVPLSKAEEREQPFRLAAPFIAITTQCPSRGEGRSIRLATEMRGSAPHVKIIFGVRVNMGRGKGQKTLDRLSANWLNEISCDQWYSGVGNPVASLREEGIGNGPAAVIGDETCEKPLP